MKLDDKDYNGALFLEELQAVGVSSDDVVVKTNGLGFKLFVRIKVDDTSGIIEQAVRDVAASHDASVMSNAERQEQAQGRIADLRNVAQNYADDVAALYAAVIAADAAGDTAQERYDRIRQVMAGADTPFQTRFTQAMESETGIDIGSIGLLNLTNVQAQDVNAFARRFANSLGMLLMM